MQEAYRFLVEDNACISYYHLKNLTAVRHLEFTSSIPVDCCFKLLRRPM